MKKLFATLVLGIPLLVVNCSAQYKDILNFSGTNNGANPNYGTLIQSGNVLYGMTSSGGAYNYGCIFSVDTNGDRYKDLHDFSNLNNSGNSPNGSLLLSDTVLYGMTTNGGLYNDGCIFRIDTVGKGYKDILDFNVSNGGLPYGSLSILGNVLFGMTSFSLSQYGLVFSVHTNGSDYEDLLSFNGSNGAIPDGDITIIGTRLYGMAQSGGAQSWGTIFSIDTNGLGYKDLYDFNNTNGGGNPYGDLTLVGNRFFGMAYYGVTNVLEDGVVFSIDTNGSGFKDLLIFNGTNGKNPEGNLTASGNFLYGMTGSGGANNKGLIFSIDTAGKEYQDLVDFTGSNGSFPGANPGGSLTRVGGQLFGMTYNGGTSNDGVVFHEDVCPLLTVATGDTNVTCNGSNNGYANAKVSKGPAPYTYSWSGGKGTKAAVNGLSAGTYTITVSDNNGCDASAMVTITQPATLTALATVTANELCNGGNNAAALATHGGGTLPFTYSWSTRGTSDTANTLRAGSYTVTITDKNGCTASASTSITQPTPIVYTTYIVSTDSVNCAGIAAVTNVSGGMPPYTYFWTPGFQLTDTIKGQCYGNDTCTITDNNNCTQVVYIVIPRNFTGIENISNSPSINVYPDPTNGNFTIQRSAVSSQWSVEVYNVLGEKVASQYNISNSTLNMDISNNADGLYLVRIFNNNGSVIKETKILKEQ